MDTCLSATTLLFRFNIALLHLYLFNLPALLCYVCLKFGNQGLQPLSLHLILSLLPTQPILKHCMK